MLSRFFGALILVLLAGCADDLTLTGLVFNEVAAQDGDYIEIMNTGTETLSLGGYALVDSKDGAPRLDKRVLFEGAAELGPGEILLIQANLRMDAVPGERTECGPGAPPRCYYAAWGVSRMNGETLYILAPDGSIVLQYDYPAAAVTMGAWGRVPDGTGAFVPTMRTPGLANMAQ